MRIITKASGEKEPFDIKKFTRSLLRSGASKEIINKIAKEVEKQKNLKTTHDIYKYAHNYLLSQKPGVAGRYNLKRALFELGSSGFPFEKFLAKIFQTQGYKVSINQIIEGICVTHEIDLVLEKDNRQYLVESKFHNTQGIKSDLKVTLYCQARFEDIKANFLKNSSNKKKIYKVWAITNTKFTSKAIQYAECVKMKLMDWAYPTKNNLAKTIDILRLHPLTTLTSLSKKQKNILIDNDLILCREIKQNSKLLKALSFPQQKINIIIKEAEEIYSSFKKA